jgi:hypothetical protein
MNADFSVTTFPCFSVWFWRRCVEGLVTAFQVGIAMSGVSIVGSLAMEWKSVKGNKIEMGMA